MPGTEAMDEEDRVGRRSQEQGGQPAGKAWTFTGKGRGTDRAPLHDRPPRLKPPGPKPRLPAFHTSLTVCPTEMFCFSGI